MLDRLNAPRQTSLDPAVVPAFVVRTFDANRNGVLGQDELVLAKPLGGPVNRDALAAGLAALPAGDRQRVVDIASDLDAHGSAGTELTLFGAMSTVTTLASTAFCFFTLGWPAALACGGFLGLGAFLLLRDGLRNKAAAKGDRQGLAKLLGELL